MQGFQLSGIEYQQFEPFFSLDDDQLKALGIVRQLATESPGFPCRVSLQDAQVGEVLLLLPYVHQNTASPYRASGPIFVRRGAQQKVLAPGELVPYVTLRQVSVRAYDANDMMLNASVCEGAHVAAEIERYFGNASVAYIHLHNAKQGCFSCLVQRV